MIYDLAAAVDSYHDHNYEDQLDEIMSYQPLTCKTDGCTSGTDWHSEYCKQCEMRHAVADAVSALVTTKGTDIEPYTRELINKHFPSNKRAA